MTSMPRACLPSRHCQGRVPQGRAMKAGGGRLSSHTGTAKALYCRPVRTGRPQAQPSRQAVLAYRTRWRPGEVDTLPLSLSSRTPAQFSPAARACTALRASELPPRGNAERACATAASGRRGQPVRMRNAAHRPPQLLRRRREPTGGGFSQQSVTNVAPVDLRVRSRG